MPETYDMDIDGDLILTKGSFAPQTNVYLAGYLVITSTYVSDKGYSGDIIFDGTTKQEIQNYPNDDCLLSEIQISNTSSEGVILSSHVKVASLKINNDGIFLVDSIYPNCCDCRKSITYITYYWIFM